MRALLPTDLDEERQRPLTLVASEPMAASRVVQRDWGAAIEQLNFSIVAACAVLLAFSATHRAGGRDRTAQLQHRRRLRRAARVFGDTP
jgi:hypothetical protein